MTRLPHFLSRFRRAQDGTILVTVAVWIPLVLVLMAFVIDAGMIRLWGHRLQISADAAALAGVSQMPDEEAVEDFALQYVQRNLDNTGASPVVRAQDIVVGNWDGEVFSAEVEPLNAVQVTARRTGATGNPFLALFSAASGHTDFDVTRVAVAYYEPSDCSGGGIFAHATLESGSDNNYHANFCLYAGDYIKIGSNNTFSPNTLLMMPDINDLEAGSDNGIINDVLSAQELQLPIVDSLTSIYAELVVGTLTSLPDIITNPPRLLAKIDSSTTLSPNTYYMVLGDVDLSGRDMISNIAVLSLGDIKFGSDTHVESGLFFAAQKMLFGSNNIIGSLDNCDLEDFALNLFALGNIELGSANDLLGVQMGTLEDLNMGSDIGSLQNVRAEALGHVTFGSANEMSGCPEPLNSDFAPVDPDIPHWTALTY